MDIRTVKNSDDLIRYFIQNLDWNIDEDDFNDIDDITYDFDADDLGLKKEEFSKISSLKQLQPISMPPIMLYGHKKTCFSCVSGEMTITKQSVSHTLRTKNTVCRK